ncbi:unnamed protein product, partial [Coregonus sp. 'balchen']
PAGFCKGAVHGDIGQPDVDVSCEIFHPKSPEVHISVPEVPIIIIPYCPTAPLLFWRKPNHNRLTPVSWSTLSPPNPISVTFSSSSMSQETPVFKVSPDSPGVPDSSSEELGDAVARPPINFL